MERQKNKESSSDFSISSLSRNDLPSPAKSKPKITPKKDSPEKQKKKLSSVDGLSSSDLSVDDKPLAESKPRVNSTKVETKAQGDLSSFQDNSNEKLSTNKDKKEKSVSEKKIELSDDLSDIDEKDKE